MHTLKMPRLGATTLLAAAIAGLSASAGAAT